MAIDRLTEKFVIVKCSDAKIEDVYSAFDAGFSDYIIPMKISQQVFFDRFFGPEGNQLETSYIAYYENKPAGVILGGIRYFDGIKTMRCGAMAISAEFRGTGVSNILFEAHKTTAAENNCSQLYLEVIKGNDRAITFYHKCGYEKIYDISYFEAEKPEELICFQALEAHSPFRFEKVDFLSFNTAVNKWDFHINWQNDLPYLKSSDNVSYFAALDEKQVIGCLSVNNGGKISSLYVDKRYRGKGVASRLLFEGLKELKASKLHAGFPNNSLAEGFFKKAGFKKTALAQYEMYLSL
ncbi:Acetyltransferase (GNAT) family protein [Bacillus sp. OV322]|uniref:GNAT family N-acetyltransferase n=1 Tax=Bacillus sp. OV322 TaxID=1882764 RepID=UPI0008F2685C|nr:GNAT family N-acetyltransferase [Bacillus sp. OV322]SFC70905.1 Acetyltransferase (GNAT) family protein [Bacillus sp. OV322]